MHKYLVIQINREVHSMKCMHADETTAYCRLEIKYPAYTVFRINPITITVNNTFITSG